MFSALLDADALFSAAVRDLLLRAAEAGLYRPLWTEQILEEMRNAILRKRKDLALRDMRRLVTHMRAAFPEAEVSGYRALIPAMGNNKDDRHVLAAAVAGRADVIVTWNTRHFPRSACEPYGVDVQTPDEFLVHAIHLRPDRMVWVVRRQAADLRKPPMDLDEILDRLSGHVPRFVEDLRRHGIGG